MDGLKTLVFLKNYGVVSSAVGFCEGHTAPCESGPHGRIIEWGRSHPLREMVILDVTEAHEIIACVIGVDKPVHSKRGQFSRPCAFVES